MNGGRHSKVQNKSQTKKKEKEDGEYSKINNGCLKLNRTKMKAQRQGKNY
jgi:hypothetical protein